MSNTLKESEQPKPGMNPIIIKVLVGIGMLVGVIFIFGFGVAVGSGQVNFSNVRTTGANKDLPNTLNYTEVNELYRALKNGYDGKIDEQKLLDGMKEGLVQAAGDPYTEFFNAEQAKDFTEQLSGSFTGIGAELGQDSNKNLIVVAPISGFPADKAGLRSQDMILAIDGKSTKDMSVDEAVKLIRGPKDTQVKLDIMRGDSERQTVAITRADIKIPSVKSDVVDGIGYLQITQFGEDTPQLARDAAQDFRDKGVKKVVVDVRDNPGGLLDASVKIASMWLPEGTTILQEKRDGQVLDTYKATGDPILKGVPTVVLINQGSASASEILAGALRDNKAATLLGEKSYGKGSVQQIQPLSNGTELKVTVARWFRPNGQNIDKKGISPDKTITMTEDDYKNNLDPQKDAAIAHLQGE